MTSFMEQGSVLQGLTPLKWLEQGDAKLGFLVEDSRHNVLQKDFLKKLKNKKVEHFANCLQWFYEGHEQAVESVVGAQNCINKSFII